MFCPEILDIFYNGTLSVVSRYCLICPRVNVNKTEKNGILLVLLKNTDTGGLVGVSQPLVDMT